MLCKATDCTGCSVCKTVCPKQAITMQPNQEGFLHPHIDSDKCINCRLCEKKCPILNSVEKNEPAQFYMGWHKDESVLKSSSSGGIFTALAEYTFKSNGVVFGACQTSNGEIIHQYAENEKDFEKFKLSKYYQSDTRDCYADVKKFLNENRIVLFSGTACQVGGLYQYLGNKDWQNLITVDVLCHGAASKKVVDGFLQSKEKEYKKKIDQYYFRVKDEKRGWYNGGGTRMKIVFADGSSVVEPNRYDTFFLGFNQNFFLRESCYRCKFCGIERISDFTIADYWGCNHPEITQKQMMLGVSLILANSNRAKNIIKQLSKIECYLIDGENAIMHNKALREPQNRPEIRDSFFALMEKNGFDAVIKSQFKDRFFKRNIKKILRLILPARIASRIVKEI